MLRIVNCPPRERSVALLVIAALLAVAPAFGSLLPEGYYAFRAGIGGVVVWTLGIGLCVSAVFWWSEVTIDAQAGELVIDRRWGLLRSRRHQRLSQYTQVMVRNEDGAVVYLEGATASSMPLDFNFNQAIIWGRGIVETERIAHEVARCLELPVRTSFPHS